MTSSRTNRLARHDTDLIEIPDAFRGSLLWPDDPDFEQARRIWNGMIDRRPALIARCRTTNDVSSMILSARAAGRPITVRCGGHNVAGTAVGDDAVMIDLSAMRDIVVDEDKQVAEVGGGCLLRDVDTATTASGLACPAGVFSYTGLSGLALGGGYGWRCRKWGLTCDHILGAEIVLADGTVVNASAEQHADLLWALRGGGGNFGIVTRFTLRLRPVGPMLVRGGLYAGDDAAAGLRAYRDFTATLSEDFHVLGGLRHARPTDPISDASRGEPVLDFLTVCSADVPGSVQESDRLFAAMPQGPTTVSTMSYLELQTMVDDSAPTGRRYYTKSGYVSELPDRAIERLVSAAGRNPSLTGSIDIEYLLGAIQRTTTADSAFPQREAPFMVSAYASWDDPVGDSASIAWARETISDLADWKREGGYSNYVSQEESAEAAAESYGSAIYARLATVKQQYDPDNLFRSSRHVIPADPARAESH